MPQGIEVDGAKVRAIRREFACLSQTEAARLVGISIPGLWKIETRGRTTLTTLRRLADVLGVHPSDLMAKPSDYRTLQATPGRLTREIAEGGQKSYARRIQEADPRSLTAIR